MQKKYIAFIVFTLKVYPSHAITCERLTSFFWGGTTYYFIMPDLNFGVSYFSIRAVLNIFDVHGIKYELCPFCALFLTTEVYPYVLMAC